MPKNLYKQKGSDNWRVRFTLNGVPVNETTGTASLRDAKLYLEQKKAEVLAGTHAPGANAITVRELCESKLESDKVNGRSSYKTVKGRNDLHMEPYFQGIRAANLTTEMLRKYIAKRQEQGAKNASINRELALLRSAFNLAGKSGRLRVAPWFPMLPEDNVRENFLEDKGYAKLADAYLKEGVWLRGLFEVGRTYGWRSGSLKALRVGQVDFQQNTIRVQRAQTKSKQGVVVKMTAVVRELLTACCAGKSKTDYVFTRDGHRIVNFAKAWKRAVTAAGLPGLWVHDLCRTGMRNMRRLGIDETVIMKAADARHAPSFRGTI